MTIQRRDEGRGKSIRIDDVGAWFDRGTRLIHLTVKGDEGFHVAISGDATRANGHPALYRELTRCLGLVGAPHPE